ncbi:MAG: lysylphosphatidylglycerol synthase transmembrane domain-containing protein [Ignavibacteriaceae bacterium]
MTSGNNKKTHHFKRALNLTFSFILTAVFLYIAFKHVDFKDVIEKISQASLLWIGVFIIVITLSHFLRAVRWKVILNSVKPGVSLKNLFGALMIGYGVNFIVPRLGEVSRAVFIGKWENLSRSSMFGTVILERIIDLIFLGISVVISIYIATEDLYKNFPWLKSTLYITIFLMICMCLFLFLIIKFKEKFYGIIIKFLSRFSEKIAHKIANIFEMLIAGFTSLKGTKNYLLTLVLSISIILLYALASYIGFYTVGMQKLGTPGITFAMAWILMSISGIGVVIPTPGGTGSYHTLAKSTLLLFGFGEVISLTYAVLTHLISMILFIVFGLISFFVLNKQHDSLFKVIETEVNEL